MLPDNVTLIVKAPNQQIEDQNVECQTSWTVRQLKGHLSEVYPSKPRADDQKIIYSGQLLDDNSVLKDVLRKYESEITHTMHLVCSNKRMETEEINSELRQRNVPAAQPTNQPETVSRPETRQNDQNHSVEMQNYLSSYMNNYGRVPPYPNYNFGDGYLPVPNDPASMANHIMMMQQAYVQYMQQYANMTRAATPPPPPAPVAEPPPAPEPEQQHDWLDHLYAASRVGILLSLFWLYGSPTRLLVVILCLGLFYYFRQIGFFRDLQVNERRNEPRQQNNDNQATYNENNGNNRNNDNQQSLLAVTWMIVTSFFTSLVPDTN
ncbi:homocysteine-responsive endoplasmic reticulum-resident ubiquitin domain member 2 protein [Danaus plexippus plexippus]|uniref:Homocysteine-responsive endoplasmic reticulum-resident ubiquitin domain member 2 protein n=1 Tax=Danaus plexippus plexippus TaxID=278856 RepID=A0A212EPE2_DANPL|nr:homocysteine-responsive endoplasmic reticulum-resident ubiquitin domain member 2 protein [Danaus plexippus plexippus]